MAFDYTIKLNFYFLFLIFFTVKNTKIGSTIRVHIPIILTTIFPNSIPTKLDPTNIIAAILIANKLIPHNTSDIILIYLNI